MFINSAFAQTTDAAAATGSVFMQFVPLLLIFVVFYFMLIRPQQKKLNEHQKMLESLRRGDKVVTGGGIIGVVSKVEDNELTIEIADNVRVRVQRGTISGLLSKTEPANDTKAA